MPSRAWCSSCGEPFGVCICQPQRSDLRLALPLLGFGTWKRRPEPVFARRLATEDDVHELPEKAGVTLSLDGKAWAVDTAHGRVPADFGDYLVTDGKGDWWPVKAPIFEQRYEVIPVAK